MNATQYICLALGIIGTIHLVVVAGLLIAYCLDNNEEIDHEDFLG